MLLGSFELDRRVAEGGTAVVWKARHIDTGSAAAVKVLTRVERTDGAASRLLLNEVGSVARLNFPTVVSVLDFGTVPGEVAAGIEGAREGSHWLAMEWLEGKDLTHGASWSWPPFRSMALDILSGLAHAHARDVVHRDLKPSNIFIEDRGGRRHATITDFGIAKSAQGLSTSTNEIWGTPAFMAPEQATRSIRDQGPWTDIYALGCVLWRIATGKLLFDGPAMVMMMHHLRMPVPEFEPRFRLPTGFESIVRKMLAKAPEDRFAFAAEARQAIERLPAMKGEVAGEIVVMDGLASPTMKLEPLSAIAKDLAGDVPPFVVRVPEDWRELPTGGEHRSKFVGEGLFALRRVPSVARGEARDLLWRALTGVIESKRPRGVTIIGDLGSGKTHLAEWIAEVGHVAGVARTLRMEHVPPPGDSESVRTMMSRAFDLEGMERDAIRDRIAFDLFGSAGPSAADEFDLETFTELAYGRRTFKPQDRLVIVIQLLRRLSEKRPLVLQIDDAQWGWEALEIAREVMRAELRVLMVITARADLLPQRREATKLRGLRSEWEFEELEIGAFDEPESRAFLQAMLPLDPKLEAVLMKRAAGNPLWMRQILGDIVERRALVRVGGRYQLRSGSSVPVPRNARELFVNRLGDVVEQFDEGARTAVVVAATMGHEVDRARWGRACGALGIVIPARLEEALVRQGLVTSSATSFRFAHPLAAEAIRATLPPEERRRVHEVCLRTLVESDHADGPGEWEQIAEHLRVLGRERDRVEALLTATKRSWRSGDLPKQRVLLDEIAEAMHGVDDSELRAERLIYEARYRINQDYDLADRLLTEALAEPEINDFQRAHAKAIRSSVLHSRSDTEGSARLLREAIPEIEEDPELLARCLVHLGYRLRALGRHDEALDVYRRADSTLSELDAPQLRSVIFNALANVELYLKRFDAAQRSLEHAAAFARESGDRAAIARSINTLGDILARRGAFAEAVERYDEAIEMLEPLQHLAVVIYSLNLGIALLARGDRARARSTLEGVLDEMHRRSFRQALPAARLALAACDAHDGQWDRVMSFLEEVEAELVDEIDLDAFQTRYLLDSIVDAEGARATRVPELVRRIVGARDSDGASIQNSSAAPTVKS